MTDTIKDPNGFGTKLCGHVTPRQGTMEWDILEMLTLSETYSSLSFIEVEK